MSRIGKQPIAIPDKVEIKIEQGKIKVKGPKGELVLEHGEEVKIEQKDKTLLVAEGKKTKNTGALRGLFRALVSNMIIGVSEGFEKKLEIEGVGFKAEAKGNKLVLNIGLSHPVEIEAPQGIAFKVEKNVISVSGIDKQLVGQTAAKIRAQKKPEPYKGKGIKYEGEVIRRKAGKKAVASE